MHDVSWHHLRLVVASVDCTFVNFVIYDEFCNVNIQIELLSKSEMLANTYVAVELY